MVAPTWFEKGLVGSRTLAARFADVANVKDYGAVGDNVADDTAAFVAALVTGKSVYAPTGNYKLTSGLTMQTRGQRLVMDPTARLIPAGSFDVLTLTGGVEHMGISGMYVEGGSMAGGNVIKVTNADRVQLDDIMVWSPWNFLYVEDSNVCLVSRAWINNCRGTYGIKWYGDAVKRSDVLNLSSVTLSGNSTSRPTGVEWDGNCHTLQTQGLILVLCGYGIRVLNTAGATNPEFGFFDDLEIDFPSLDGVRLEAGSHYFFTPSLYVHGSVGGSGVYAGAGVAADKVVISGGKLTGHARYALEVINAQNASDIIANGNTLGNFSGTLRTTSPRFQVDGNAYFTLSGTTAILGMDANDYIGYNRTSNLYEFFIGGVAPLSVSSTAVTAATFVGALTGNANTATSAATLTTARTINGTSFNGSSNITITAANPSALTRGTYLTGANYDGSAATTWAVDATNLNTASTVVARDASGNFSAGTITATRFALDGNAYFTLSGVTAVLGMDANDYIGYDRTGDQYNIFIGGAAILTASPTRVEVMAPLRLPSYTVATVPSASVHARSLIYVSDGAGSKRLAISDGTAWLWPDGTVVS